MQQKDSVNIGGKAAREGRGPLWEFLPENNGSFRSPDAEMISRLYFPLMNRYGMKCSISPEMKGDIASSFEHYLTAATVTEELHRNVSNRNFWIKVDGQQPWSASGNSVYQKSERWQDDGDDTEIEGKIGAFICRRSNPKLGLKCKTTVFTPDTDDFLEIMKVEIENITDHPLTFNATSATPIFGRHPDNFRDHRQVTTMFQKIFREDHGVRVKPTIVHDEQGHSENHVNYLVLGFEEDGKAPVQIWSSLYDFIGEGGSLDNPEALYSDMQAPTYAVGETSGMEAIGAMQYKQRTLMPGETVSYIVLHGITEELDDIKEWQKKFGSESKIDQHLQKTLEFWQQIANEITVTTADNTFDNWVKWISFQLKCRQIYGNSFLPDFGYGRGGRGWRDLWQDLLSIFLIDPDSARNEIINSIKGVRVDGSNATIIGTEPGTFIADRNKVPRTWSDHGAWPAFVINFYIQQTGDLDILFQEVPFWKDQFIHRSKKHDGKYKVSDGCWQKTTSGEIYESSVLEHLIIQQLSAFYNVGDHSILLLEGADWNDTYDMAREKGESVGFYAFYAQNLKLITSWLSALYERGVKEVVLMKEIGVLLNGYERSSDYSVNEKQKRLNKYFKLVSHEVSGEKIKVGIQTLILDLMLKADHISQLIREQEWIPLGDGKGFFNGHYDNKGIAIDGLKGDRIMMDLTTQVMMVMQGVATADQIAGIIKASDYYLKDGRGYRICTPFTNIDMNIGRITGFVYGHKEHGSKWMQQNVMMAYGLYLRGFKEKASEIIQDTYELSTDSATSKIFPGLPSYFGPGDKGSYAYLTGSSTWFILSLTTQIFGVRGEMGNLCLEPKIPHNFFDDQGEASIAFTFRGIRIKLIYHFQKPAKSDNYKLNGILINGKKPSKVKEEDDKYIIDFNELEKACLAGTNQMNIELS